MTHTFYIVLSLSTIFQLLYSMKHKHSVPNQNKDKGTVGTYTSL